MLPIILRKTVTKLWLIFAQHCFEPDQGQLANSVMRRLVPSTTLLNIPVQEWLVDLSYELPPLQPQSSLVLSPLLLALSLLLILILLILTVLCRRKRTIGKRKIAISRRS